jgi:hypothetical protein
LGGFWLIVRNDYHTEEEKRDMEEGPLNKLRSKLFHPKSQESEE